MVGGRADGSRSRQTYAGSTRCRRAPFDGEKRRVRESPKDGGHGGLSGSGTLQERAERLAGTIRLGGPVQDFERVGQMQLAVLLLQGLRPGSRVLDVGCGCLRAGYWLMHFLDPGCY